MLFFSLSRSMRKVRGFFFSVVSTSSEAKEALLPLPFVFSTYTIQAKHSSPRHPAARRPPVRQRP